MPAPIHVLHVDDDPARTRLTADALEAEAPSLRVVGETSVPAALECLESAPIDCVVSDYEMPEMDGLEFLDAVRADHPDLPFVLYTSKGSEQIASEAISAGVTDYLQKEGGTDQFALLANRITNAVERYRTTRELARREESYRRAQRIADIGNWDWDVTSGELYWSEQVYHIFGLDPDDFEETYDAFLEFVHPEDREAVQAAVDSALAGSGEYAIDHRVVRPDDTVRTVHEEGEVVFEGDEPVRMSGTVQDVTDRLPPETAGGMGRATVRQDLRAFRRAVDAAGHSIYFTEPDGTITYVNDAFESITGWDREEAVGQTPRILKSGVHDKAFYADLWGTILGGEVWENEVVNRRKSGQQYHVNQTIAPVTDDDGEIESFVAVNADITRQKAREQELRASRRKYESLVEAAPDAIFIADADTGEILQANEAAAALLGRPCEEIVGSHQSTIHPADETEKYAALFDDHVRGDTLVRRELPDGSQIEVETASGRTVPVEINATLVELDDRRVFQGIFRDISARLERERTLERQNERLEQFATVVSHDLRNPLSVAKSTVELAGETDLAEHADRLATAHDRMESIIDDALQLAREGEAVTETDRVYLEHVASTAWETLSTVDATLDIEGRLCFRADESRVQRLFENLYRNAIEHGGDAVTVRVGPTDGDNGFYVADDGPGIPPEKRDRVLETGYTSSESGTGLGLAIVREIATSHGWTVDVTESRDGGARFEIRDVEEWA